jgi:hypothetical protein
MDFKKLLNTLDSMDAPVATPAAPQIAPAVQLNEDAQLRVLSGRTTYVAEAKKKAEEKVAEAMKDGDKKNVATGTVEKTKTGIVHKSNKAYGGSEEKADDADDAPKGKKKTAKESINTEAFKGKFAKMVEAKKKGGKPDFLDLDKDGDKTEPMKKAASDKKAGPKKGVNPFAKKDESVKESDDMKVGAKKKSATGGTIEKTATGIKHTAGKNYSGKAAEKEEKSKKDESKMMPKGKKRPVAESVETAMTFREMMKLVVESGGQQQIDPIDSALFAWAQRVAASKYTESTKAEVFAGMLYERNGGVFEMYDVLSEDQK